jgi:hypothetical protein
MQVSLKKIFSSFLDNYIKIHFDIKENQYGLTTSNSDKGKFTLSKHSKTITHWFTDEYGKNFEEFQIVRNNGNIEIQKKQQIVMKFSCPTEPLTF